MEKGDRIRLKDGSEAVITSFGMSDFIGGAFPVYITIVSGRGIGTATHVMSNELKRREEKP